LSEPALADLIERWYEPTIQFSVGQVVVIAQAIVAAGSGANVLVFGCGNDSRLWHQINRNGRTVFLEHDAKWLASVRRQWPELEVHEVTYAGRTVGDSLPIDEAALAKFAVPAVLAGVPWAVIVVDSPQGYRVTQPGRSLPIYWAAEVATPSTHVFVDDYDRALERAYADRFFRSRRPWNVEIERVQKSGMPTKGRMLWSIGVPSRVAVAAPNVMPAPGRATAASTGTIEAGSSSVASTTGATAASARPVEALPIEALKYFHKAGDQGVLFFHGGMSRLLPDLFRHRTLLENNAIYFTFPWFVDEEAFVKLRRRLRKLRKLHPDVKPRGLCMLLNSRQEVAYADRHLAGRIDYLHFSNAALINEELFEIGAEPAEFDAVYNARANSFKRHWLTAGVSSKMFLSYKWRVQEEDLAALHPRLWLQDLPYREIGRALQRARVGLILSEEEGACYASLEYLLSGLPVVSTLSRGGRDEYYDDTNSIIVEPSPEALARGVERALERLEAGSFDRARIRQGAIDRMAFFRRTLAAHLQVKLAAAGSDVDAAQLLTTTIRTSAKAWKFRNMRLKGLTPARPDE
jgi:hypothetical protein